jgi:hypothetical protein
MSRESAVIAEPMLYVTRMVRCKDCGVGFPSAIQTLGSRALMDIEVEMCPAGAVNDSYESFDYYFG